MTEKRTAPRHRVLKAATIAYAGNGASCTVRNMSASGAAIDLSERINLPQSFMLLIESDQFMRRCRPVWSVERRVGVAFC
jgi:PilZ domain